MIALLLLQLWTSIPDAETVLSGNWQSCREEDGQYGERIYEHVEHGKVVWEFHMGPEREFALYVTRQEDEHSHRDPANLLGRFYGVGDQRTWVLPKQKLRVSAVQAGGSRTDCESFVVSIKKLP